MNQCILEIQCKSSNISIRFLFFTSCIYEKCQRWEEASHISSQSSKSSFRKMIQIFRFAHSALPLLYSLFRFKKSSLNRVVYTKSVKESEEISYNISSQSLKNSFRKIQILEYAYSALLLCSLFSFKNDH